MLFLLWSLWFFHTLLGLNIASQSVVAVGLFACLLAVYELYRKPIQSIPNLFVISNETFIPNGMGYDGKEV